MKRSHFDLFVIGAGSGGVRAARMAASRGLSVGIAEHRYLGGTCVNVGCIPKKLFVYGSEFSEAFDDQKGYGWSSDKLRFDWQVLRDNKDKEINRLNGIYESLLESAGVRIFKDHAEFLASNVIALESCEIEADKTLIATGSWPISPEFPGHEYVDSSNEMFHMESLPKSVLIYGGGYIAVEFASIFAGFGVATTLVYRGELLLRGFDRGIREFLTQELQAKGIELLTNTTIERIESDHSAKSVFLSNGVKRRVDVILSAIGRAPNVSDLNLDATAVSLSSSGAIEIDGNFQTADSRVFALGDVIDRYQLTPVAIHEAMRFTDYLTSGVEPTLDYGKVPTAIFSQPAIGTIGPSEEDARDQIANLQIFESTFKPLKFTLTDRQERAFMKLVVDGGTNKVIGAHMVGPEAGEIIQGIAVAITAGATKDQFDATIGIHPSSAEEFVTMRDPVR